MQFENGIKYMLTETLILSNKLSDMSFGERWKIVKYHETINAKHTDTDSMPTVALTD